MKLRLASPSSLVDLGAIDGLVGIDCVGKITIGAMTTYATLRDSPRAEPRSADGD